MNSNPPPHAEDDTILALSTPNGESAIAVIRISGPQCPQLAQEVFKQDTLTPRQATLATYYSQAEEILDQVVFVYYPHGASYTGQATLEVSTHGNPFIIHKIIDDMIARGCRMAEPGEFTRLAFIHGKMDLSQAEAVADVVRARNDKALAAAHRQLAGALGKHIETFIQRLLQILAEIEAYIDFPEEDIPQEGPLPDLRKLSDDIARLRETQRYSELLHEGIKTIIVGEPNAGKSSLLNALVGEERAIVSTEAGTTRDFISETMMLGPYCIQILDTAGLRDTTSDIEKMGIAKTLEKMQTADFFLYIFDSASDTPTLPADACVLLKPERTLVIANKTDLLGKKPAPTPLPTCPQVSISLKTGTGWKDFQKTWLSVLEKDLAIPGNDELIVSARHAEALGHAWEALQDALQKNETHEAIELIASDLRKALDALGEITGKVDNESMLDELFANFCIGK